MLSVDQTTLRLDVDVRIEADFDFLSAEYRAFYGPSRATAFQAPLWLDMIHRRLAKGLKASQHTLTIRNRVSGELLAVLPLVLQRVSGISMLQPADFGVCDYNCAVADKNTLAMIAADAELRSRIDALLKPCDILMFRKVREDSFDMDLLFPNAKSTPGENAAYHSDIGDDFDTWRSRTIRKKFSKELGRLQRQTARDFGSYEHRAACGEAEIRTAFDFLKKARRGRFDEDLLDNPLYFEFYRDYALAASAAGEAVTYVSYVAGEPIAVLFGLVGDGEFHAVLIGSDTERFGRNSPGTQIIYQIIKKRFGEGFRRFDMGLGNSGYKTHFRVDETQLRNYTRTRSLAGAAMALVYHHAKPVKNFLRKYVRNVR
jgi:CelD/BcsL family acetyltransferase involved in cellulose biosynthesis